MEHFVELKFDRDQFRDSRFQGTQKGLVLTPWRIVPFCET